MWNKRKNQEVETPPYPVCIYCGKGYLKPVEVNFHGKLKIVYRCSKCGEEANYGKSPEPVPVGNTDFDRDPSKTQRKNPFAR